MESMCRCGYRMQTGLTGQTAGDMNRIPTSTAKAHHMILHNSSKGLNHLKYKPA